MIHTTENPVTEVQDDHFHNLERLKSPEEPFCRICFDTATESKVLISPCKCTGSMRLVHEDCVKTWIISSSQEIKESSCDICKEQFKVEIKYARSCKYSHSSEECFKILIFPLAIIIISTIFSIVIIYLVNGIQQGNIGSEEKVYFALIMSACLAILTTLVCILTKSIKAVCCALQVIQWKILSIQPVLDETFEVTHQDQNNDLELKQGSINKGKNTIVPLINFPISQENSAFLPQVRSGPQTERLPEESRGRVCSRLQTTRVFK